MVSQLILLDQVKFYASSGSHTRQGNRARQTKFLEPSMARCYAFCRNGETNAAHLHMASVTDMKRSKQEAKNNEKKKIPMLRLRENPSAPPRSGCFGRLRGGGSVRRSIWTTARGLRRNMAAKTLGSVLRGRFLLPP